MHIALLDWDNTLHRGYTIYGLADYLMEKGIVTRELLHHFKELEQLYLTGGISYAEYTERTCESFAQGLTGCSALLYKEAVQSYRPFNEAALYEDVHALFHLLKKHNVHTYLVSGAPFDVLNTYAEEFDLRGIFAFQLEVSGDTLTGRVSSNYGLDKERILSHPLLQAPGAVHLLSMGDAVADIPLLDHSLIPIVVGKQRLALRPDSDAIHFTGEKWNLELLEERIRGIG
ncbi:HAD family hydrolase [Paenibacillus radicis (ex Gao et al. 2016)]|uniref:Uncharacterized protein n=1 Tax=Paenibacillus radicis (ex Gao et al. 2016) TaxID=1737354 RepID=A0A917LXT4_9BACL|nr:HAD family hydrolase [Paenibacillus radicis (ex Gao et al. 2016)]GGG64803.1 hypothetical protein GCM10010918_18680 [Paenibacillus radicis (ex Gao et al. 2016)]